MAFAIYPAVDLQKGRAVVLEGGERTLLDLGDPVAAAQRWVDAGARWLHVVDLDGAAGAGSNRELLLDIVRSRGDAKVQVGGGIRTLTRAAFWLGQGASRVIFGTAAVERPEMVERTVEQYGPEAVVVAVDARRGEVATRGWTRGTGATPRELVERFEGVAGTFLFTNVDVEGRGRGLPLGPVKELTKLGVPILVAGGISSLDDVRAIRDAGAAGAVLGRGLYEGKIALPEALALEKGV
ncbi:MAG: 1-(5-phosphoribosyl)-5-[(5-phosphoribosylamino)methylideneamino]imidazole-4-carboxamide isomerase [Halobacteria archaeon]